MLQEIERLRGELAAVTKSRDRLREMVCAILPVNTPEETERQIDEMMQKPMRGIDDIIEDLMRPESGRPQKGRQILA